MCCLLADLGFANWDPGTARGCLGDLWKSLEKISVKMEGGNK